MSTSATGPAPAPTPVTVEKVKSPKAPKTVKPVEVKDAQVLSHKDVNVLAEVSGHRVVPKINENKDFTLKEIQVKATAKGHYDHYRRDVGEKFTIKCEAHFSENWMEKI